ncbi:MAG: membrane protein insertase YidC [Gemmatimonadales bacterium]|jgi:YidC/Oxa1 family membrane protein insertase
MGTEKRLLLAVVMMLAVVFGVNVLFPPPRPPEGGVATDTASGIPASQPPTATQPPAESLQSETPARPAPVDTVQLPELEPTEVATEEDTIWVNGPLYKLGFASRGGRLVSAVMTQFESLAPATKGQPVELVPAFASDFLSHRWVVGDDTLDLRTAQFEFSPPGGLTLQSDGPTKVLTLTYRHPGTSFVAELRYTFDPERYVIDLAGRITGVQAAGWWAIGLGPGLKSNEWDPEADYKSNLTFMAKSLEGIVSQKVADVGAGERVTLDGPFDWVAIRTKYFVSALVLPPDADEGSRFAGLMIRGLSEPYRADGVVSFPVSRQGEFEYDLYLGPQDYSRLSAAGHDLDEVNPYGYKWLQPVLRPLAGAITTMLLWMHRFLGLGYGWILIIFGVGIRVVLFPLYQKSMRSQMATMRVQPLMKEIQDKHKGDPQRLQQEMMKLYREHKINPLGGCLPMLLPFPILIALFFVFRDTIEFRGVPFLWLPDLSRPDPMYIIPVLMGASVFLMQWIGQRSMPQSNPQMKMMMWIMPIMLTVLFLKFASGLNLYYATMNIASLPQQLYLAKERKAVANQPPLKRKSKG